MKVSFDGAGVRLAGDRWDPTAAQAPAGTGHMVAGDDNDVFTGRLGAFLGRLPPPAG